MTLEDCVFITTINIPKFWSNLPSEIFQVITSSCSMHPCQRGDQLVMMFTCSLMVVIQCVGVITFPHNGYCDWLIKNIDWLPLCTVCSRGVPGGGRAIALFFQEIYIIILVVVFHHQCFTEPPANTYCLVNLVKMLCRFVCGS